MNHKKAIVEKILVSEDVNCIELAESRIVNVAMYF
jgi:hypothetical protein